MTDSSHDDASQPDSRRTVHARWQGESLIALSVRDGEFNLASDESSEGGGTNAGPMPSELLFSSLASCFAMAVAWVARKRRVVLPDLEVNVRWGYNMPDRRYDQIQVEALSSLAESAPEEWDLIVRRAVEVCWVSRTMSQGVSIAVEASTLRK